MNRSTLLALLLAAGPATAASLPSFKFQPVAVPAGNDACDSKPELEGSAKLTYSAGGKPETLEFAYASCSAEPRNDYLPPYEERYFKGPKGYLLILVTEEGNRTSGMVLYKDRKYLAGLPEVDHAKLQKSGQAVAGEVPGLGKVSLTLVKAEG